MAIAASPSLVRILGDLDSVTHQQPPLLDADTPAAASLAAAADGSSSEAGEQLTRSTAAWAVDRRGSALLSTCIDVLAARHCSAASRRSALDVLDLILELDAPLQLHLLGPCVVQLLVNLKDVVTAAADSKSGVRMPAKVSAPLFLCTIHCDSGGSIPSSCCRSTTDIGLYAAIKLCFECICF